MNFNSKFFIAFFIFSSSLIAFSKQFLIAKFFIPSDFGIYSKFYIVSTFSISFGALGLYYGSIYNISKNLNNKLISIIKYKIDLLWGYIYFTPILVLILCFTLNFSSFYEYFLLIFFSFSQILFVISYVGLNLKNSLQFSKTLFYKNVFTLIPVLIIAYYFNNIYYAIASEAILIVVQLIYLRQFKHKFYFVKFSKIFNLFLETKTYLGSVLTASILFFCVRIIASNRLSPEDLGIYFLGFSLVIIGNQFQYLFSVILNPIFSLKSRNKEFSVIYIMSAWIITCIISIIVYFTLYNLKDLVFEFFPNYKKIEIIYIPFCCLGLAKMTEIISIYFILDGKVKFNLHSNTVCLLGILIYSSFYWNNLNSLQSFSNLIYLEALLILIFPLIFYLFSESRFNKTLKIE